MIGWVVIEILWPAEPQFPSVFGPALVERYAVNERMNQIVLEHLDPDACLLNREKKRV